MSESFSVFLGGIKITWKHEERMLVFNLAQGGNQDDWGYVLYPEERGPFEWPTESFDYASGLSYDMRDDSGKTVVIHAWNQTEREVLGDSITVYCLKIEIPDFS